MKLLRLIRRRHLAYELLAEYDDGQRPVDHERWKRSLERLSEYAASHPVNHGGADRWRASVERMLTKYPDG